MTTAVGLFGGTFNPFHQGHLDIIQASQEEVGFSPLIVMPCGLPPHKQSLAASSEQRLEMTRLACQGLNNVEVWNYEILKNTPAYTFETLLYLKKQLLGKPLWLILGSDSFLNLRKWHRGLEIPSLCHALIGLRSPLKAEDISQHNEFMELKPLFDEAGHQVRFLKSPLAAISSSTLRSDGTQQKKFIPTPVLNFLIKEGLYVTEGKPS